MRLPIVPERPSDILQPRGYERCDLHFVASGVTAQGAPFPIVISNLSPGGFRADMAIDLPPPAAFDISLGVGGTRSARVVWAQGRRYGCRFDVPLDPVEL